MVAELRCSTTSAEIAEYMQRVREQSSELLIEEWNLLSLAYKNAVGSRRAAWRVITSTEARAKDMQRLQDKKEHARDLYSRMPNFRLKNKENFEEDFKHRAVCDGKINERKLQEWIDEMQPKVHAVECQL